MRTRRGNFNDQAVYHTVHVSTFIISNSETKFLRQYLSENQYWTHCFCQVARKDRSDNKLIALDIDYTQDLKGSHRNVESLFLIVLFE